MDESGQGGVDTRIHLPVLGSELGNIIPTFIIYLDIACNMTPIIDR